MPDNQSIIEFSTAVARFELNYDKSTGWHLSVWLRRDSNYIVAEGKDLESTIKLAQERLNIQSQVTDVSKAAKAVKGVKA